MAVNFKLSSKHKSLTDQKFSVYELGNNILFAKVETFAADLNVKQNRGGGYGGNLIHGFSNLQYFLNLQRKVSPYMICQTCNDLFQTQEVVKEQIPRY